MARRDWAMGFAAAGIAALAMYGSSAASSASNPHAVVPEKPALLTNDGVLPIAPKHADAKPATDKLYPACIEGRYGYIDAVGNVVIPGQWDFADAFHDGLARVGSITKDGYEYTRHSQFIDTTGTVVIPDVNSPDLGDTHFSEGLAPFVDENGKTGYIDRTGKVAIKPQFWCDMGEGDCGCSCEAGAAGSFENGVAWAKVGHEEVLIDKSGKRLMKGEMVSDLAGRLVEDRIPFRQDGLVGYKNQRGEIVIKPQFADGREFVEGFAAVTPNGMAEAYTYIDKSGRQICDRVFDYAYDFSEGMALASGFDEMDYTYYLVSTTGKVIDLPKGLAPSINGFSNGLLSATISTDHTSDEFSSHRWTESQEVFINTAGEIVARFRPSDTQNMRYGDRIIVPFDGHLAQIFNQDEGRCYWVNGRGQVVWADSEEPA